MASSDIWDELRGVAPNLVGAVEELTTSWVTELLERLDRNDVPRYPKTLNDAVWGTVELTPSEVLLLDSPLLQRLRGIRQLGMAHLVYPGAGYTRLEHSLGVLESAQRIVDALAHNAQKRKRYSITPDASIPDPSERDRVSTRLAALLHDVGHAPFSHATEHLIALTHEGEFRSASELVRGRFEGVTGIDPAELMSVLFVLSGPMRSVFEHARFDIGGQKADFAPAVAARILGSRSFLNATYLSGVVSGPLDADKIDYMARDAHHAGLPLALDITRLVSQLEVVTVTPGNAINEALRLRATEAGGRFYELGIARAGLGAFEQLVMARVMLYERLYYHHKIRTAEGLVRNLVHALEERGSPVTLKELFAGFGDDVVVDVWGGDVRSDNIASGGATASRIAGRIRKRDLLHRAYAFSSRFLAKMDGLPDAEREETLSLLWSGVTGALEDFEQARALAQAIFVKATEIAKGVPTLASQAENLLEAEIIVDLPKHGRVAKSTDILVALESGRIGTPNLFFNADKWGAAYTHQKQCGYVFAPRKALQLVSLAARIVFFDRFNVVMSDGADAASKTHDLQTRELLLKAHDAGLCSLEALEMLSQTRPTLMQVREGDLTIPPAIASANPELAKRLADEFFAVSRGLPASVHRAVVEATRAMLVALTVIEQGGDFVKSTRPDEKNELQSRLRDCLRAAQIKVDEGTEIAGGETDLILSDTLILENKVLGETSSPFEELGAAGWQARRYALALAQKVRFICAAYKPPFEADLPPLAERVRVRPAAQGEGAVEVQFVIPYGHGIPSRASKRVR